jgi:kynurenine formamidase
MKRIRPFVIGYALALALFLFAQQRHATPTQPGGFRAIVDLSHTMNAQVPAFEPSARPLYQAKTIATIAKDKYFARSICLPEHFGTHIDAPAHFVPGLWTVDQIPPDRLIGPLVVLDVRAGAKNDPDYLVSVEDLARWEKANGSIPAGAIVIARTGWDSRWSSAKDFRNADRHAVLHFPGYSLDAAKFLVEARSVFGIGIDTLSVDYGPSSDFPVHRYALGHSVYQLESVANLDRVPARGAIVVIAPMKLQGGSGSPVRIFALLP